MNGNPLLGTWRLRSHVVTTAAGVRSHPYGERPTGYLSYSADGRMQVIGAAQDRAIPAGPSPTQRERAALHDTLFAYAGTYTIDGGRIVHHVDISWNETWTGSDQVRLFELRGNTLTLTTRIKDADTGSEAHYALVWEKLDAPHR